MTKCVLQKQMCKEKKLESNIEEPNLNGTDLWSVYEGQQLLLKISLLIVLKTDQSHGQDYQLIVDLPGNDHEDINRSQHYLSCRLLDLGQSYARYFQAPDIYFGHEDSMMRNMGDTMEGITLSRCRLPWASTAWNWSGAHPRLCQVVYEWAAGPYKACHEAAAAQARSLGSSVSWS